MKKIFAKELAALAVLALAFTGCNTAFEGTTANFAEKESEYTDRSGATQTATERGAIACTDSINNTNKKNVVTVRITSFSKINIGSADEAIHFQQLTNNSTAGYYPIRGADLPKTRISVNENNSTTIITYEVDGTGVTANKVALFVDAQKLKTKGGTPVLALDGNLKRGEVSDSFVKYLDTNATGTTITGVDENFCPTYAPTGATQADWLVDTNSKEIGKRRFAIAASNKNASRPGTVTPDYESGLAGKLNDAVVLQYRKPGSRTYTETKLSWTYHETTSTATPLYSDPYAAHTYTADFAFDEIGTEYRLILTYPDGFVAPDWYKEVYGHPAIVYGAGNGVGTKLVLETGNTYTLHKAIPSYLVVNATAATTGSDATSSFVPTDYAKAGIKTAQSSFFTVSDEDNWFKVSPSSAAVRDILDPATTKDFIVVDANNKKVAADVEVITYSYNDSTTLSGKINYVKITLKDVRYRNYSGFTAANKTLKVLVGSGTKIKENKNYPAQLTFGQWKDVTDDDASGYVQIN